MVTTARRLVAFLTLLMLAFAAASGPAAAQIPYVNLLFNEPRYAAIVVDANSGEVLYSKHADSPRYPASITKIMTLYLTFEALSAGRLSLNDSITVSAHAASMSPTKLGIPAGGSVKVDDAIRAMAIKSANDMAVAMAEKIGGSESRFAALMTLRAQELGMTNTRFVNASGLPDSRQLTSARDIAILSRSVMRDYPQYYGYFGQRQFVYRGNAMANHNHLLDSMPGVDGLKTGFTNASGFNLAASATRDGRRLIAVVLGGNSSSARDNNVQDLLTTGFDVLRRRDRGEVITVAQNLFEPEPTGPIMARSVEQGDADEPRGLKIVVASEPARMRPIADPEFRPVRASDPQTCASIKVTKTVKGRHGRRQKVTTTERRCTGDAKVTEVSSTTPCQAPKSAKGRRARARAEAACEKSGPREVADASPGKAEKSADKVRWQVQVGAFKRKADAREQLAMMARRFSSQFADAEADVGGAINGMFRARFVGLTASAARQACVTLKARGQHCTAAAMG